MSSFEPSGEYIRLAYRSVNPRPLRDVSGDVVLVTGAGGRFSHWLPSHRYHWELLGTVGNLWELSATGFTELYRLLFRSWHWQGACSEAGWLGMSGGLCGQVGHISYVKCGGKGNKQSDQEEMWNWISLWAGRQKLTGAQWTRSKRQEVFVDHDGHCHGDRGDDGRCSIEDHGDCDWRVASGLAWAFQCDVSKREEVAEMARWGWTISC